MKKSQLLIVLCLSTTLIASAGDFGVSIKGSTNGLGADVYYRPFKSLAIKAGYEIIDVNVTAQTMQPLVGDALSVSVPMPSGGDLGFDLGANFKTGGMSFQVGFQPIGLFYLTAGYGTFLLDAAVIGSPTSDLQLPSQNVNGNTVNPYIPKDKLGDFSISIKPTSNMAPYVGIGLGSFVPRKSGVSFGLEVGAYYTGAFVMSAQLPSGFIADNIDYGGATPSTSQKQQVETEMNNIRNDLQANLDTQMNDLNNLLKPYPFYPVLKLTIGIRLAEFGKK